MRLSKLSRGRFCPASRHKAVYAASFSLPPKAKPAQPSPSIVTSHSRLMEAGRVPISATEYAPASAERVISVPLILPSPTAIAALKVFRGISPILRFYHVQNFFKFF